LDPGAVVLFVCTACQRSETVGQQAPGVALVGQLRAALAGNPGVTVEPVDCLAVCDRPCTIAFAGTGKWTYVIGDVDPDRDLDDLVLATTRLAASGHGVLTLAERPEFFRKGVVSRVPPMIVRR
jgi:predicted metal-binding protein